MAVFHAERKNGAIPYREWLSNIIKKKNNMDQQKEILENILKAMSLADTNIELLQSVINQKNIGQVGKKLRLLALARTQLEIGSWAIKESNAVLNSEK